MSQQFRTVTTNAGRNAVREALTQGKTVKLSHMSVGDGGGNPVTPLSTMTKLVNERFRAQINDIVLDPATPDLFTAELFIPQAEGGWYIREVGLWMDDGTLFAVGNTPLTEKPDISSGAATDLLVRLIIRVLDAATVSIEIDPAQVLATREYVDRKLDAHNKDGGAHETLARKSVQIKAGTGLTGGGTLEADRTLTVKYGNTAGTACQGNDVRLADARTPKPHKATHQTGGSDALTPADIGAAPASHTSVEATDTVLGHAKASQTTPKAAGTAAVGTEKSTFARGDHMHPAQTTITGNAGTATKLSTARTIDCVSFNGSANIIHYGTCSTAAETEAKAVNCTGFVLATGARIAVRFTVTNTAANPTLNVNATGAKAIRYRNAAIAAGYLAANRTYDFIYDGTYFQLIGDIDTNTTYAVATQAKNGLLSAADKKALDYCEALRLSMIGVPRYWRSTTLPENHVWANGDLALFADWPELKKVYDAGGFAGMLLAYNANSATIAANLGKWRPNAANPTGLYVPNLSEQFFRGWTGAGREAGSWMTDTGRTIQGMVNYDHLAPMETSGVFSTAPGDGNGYNMSVTSPNYGPTNFTIDAGLMWGSDHVGSAFAPEHVLLPVILYLGLHT
jgi:phage-related tail fiber protein